MRNLVISAVAVVSAIALGSSSHVAHAAPQKDNKKTEQAAQMVVIQPGDSLSKIATEKQSTIERLYFANTDIVNPDLIYPGDDLRVPTPTEELVARPMPVAPAAVVEVPAPAPVAEVAAPEITVAPVPAPQRAQAVAAPVAGGSVWDQLAQCESGGNWSINTGNGFYGGLQFTLSSWQAVGGTGYPHGASREEQIARGEQLLALQGWGAWPACTSKLGLR